MITERYFVAEASPAVAAAAVCVAAAAAAAAAPPAAAAAAAAAAQYCCSSNMPYEFDTHRSRGTGYRITAPCARVKALYGKAVLKRSWFLSPRFLFIKHVLVSYIRALLLSRRGITARPQTVPGGHTATPRCCLFRFKFYSAFTCPPVVVVASYNRYAAFYLLFSRRRKVNYILLLKVCS